MSETYLDMDIIKLRQMYLEEKVNLNSRYVFLENRIIRLVMRHFLDGKFSILCPECLIDVTDLSLKKRCPEKESSPFLILRMPHKSMVFSLYETALPPLSGVPVCDDFVRLFPNVKIENRGTVETTDGFVPWFSFRKTTMGKPIYHQIFSVVKGEAMIIGHMQTHMEESERFHKLLERMMVSIQLYVEEKKENERTVD